jgi:CHAT domain-containing protein
VKLLYVAPRPDDPHVDSLPAKGEFDHIYQTLREIEEVHIDSLEPPTYEALCNYLEDNEVHILHFDGHGTFNRYCNACKTRNHPHLIYCANCRSALGRVEPRGELAFEDGSHARKIDWIPSKRLGLEMYNREVRLAVLSACSSATVRGNTLLGGVAPALIYAGVPAVVATQLPISSTSAATFVSHFYRSLARFDSIPAAVNNGRKRIFQTNEWHIPVLYLRSDDTQHGDDDHGRLFRKANEEV